MKTVFVLMGLVGIALAAQPFAFATIGDYGCEPIGGWHAQDEVIVAKQFATAAAQINARFILNPGDNFYYCGVQSKDDAMWNATYENIFTEPSTMVPWYNALGNHDYGYPGSAQAQLDYVSPNNNRWKMPGRYYYERLVFPEVNISLVVLDASPCQSEYTSSDPSGWDPCGSVIPGCPGCTFHENVIKQSCSAQLAWLQNIVTTIPGDDWKIAMIHAPAMDIDVEDLITPLQQSNFQLVVNGHVHLLAHYTIDGNGTYITSGAGCMVRVPDSDTAGADEKKAREGQPKLRSLRQLKASSCTKYSQVHTCEIVYQKVTAGYTTHVFSSDFQTLTTYLYDWRGEWLHTAVATKNGGSAPVPPGPVTWTPSPVGPNPAPAGTCCYYSDSQCYAGNTCCNDEGQSYKEYECKYGSGQEHYCQWTGTKCVVPN